MHCILNNIQNLSSGTKVCGLWGREKQEVENNQFPDISSPQKLMPAYTKILLKPQPERVKPP